MSTDQLFQIVLVLVGVISQFVSSAIEQKLVKRILSVVGAVTIVLVAAWVGSSVFSQPNPDAELSTIAVTTKPSSQPGLSVIVPFSTVLQEYDFEEGVTSPWEIHPSYSKRVSSFGVDTAEDIAQSGEKLLSIDVDFTENENSTILKAVIAENEARAIGGYVFVPESGRSVGVRFSAQWVISSYEDNDRLNVGPESFESPEMFSDDVAFNPGKWIPVSISVGTGYRDRGKSDCYVIWKKGIYVAHLVLWSDKPYSGPIFVDHIQILSK